MAFLRKVLRGGTDLAPPSQGNCDYHQLDKKGRVVSRQCPATELPPKDPTKQIVRFIAMSDTHETHLRFSYPNHIPDGDVFLHCGDVLLADHASVSSISQKRVKKFFAWLNALPHKVKIVTAGNHDCELERCDLATLKTWASPAIFAVNEVVEVPVFFRSPSNTTPASESRIEAPPSTTTTGHDGSGVTSVKNCNSETQYIEASSHTAGVVEPPTNPFSTPAAAPTPAAAVVTTTVAKPTAAIDGDPSSCSFVILRCLTSAWSLANTRTSPNRAFQGKASLAALLGMAGAWEQSREDRQPCLHPSESILEVAMTHQGSDGDVMRAVLSAVKPTIHFGGHVHQEHGHRRIAGVPSFNAAMMLGGFAREKMLNVTVVDCEL